MTDWTENDLEKAIAKLPPPTAAERAEIERQDALLSDTTKKLATIAPLIWGTRWQTDCAAALGYTDRTVRNWLRGVGEPSQDDMTWIEIYADWRIDCIEAALANKPRPKLAKEVTRRQNL